MSGGALVAAAWAKGRGVELLPQAGELVPLLILGLLFGAQIGTLNLGVARTSPAYATVILTSNPIFANLFGHFLPSEHRLTPFRLLGLALAFGGICFLATGRPIAELAPDPLTGNLLLIASAVLLGIRNVYTRLVVQSVHPLRAVTWQMAFSLPVYLIPAILLEPFLAGPLTKPPIIALTYQILIVAGLCFVVWTAMLRRHAAGTLSVLGFTIPFFGVLLSALVLAEPITGRILVAGALVTAGIVMVGRG
jgi:drug/metabolite transporter (DMT)-like permease